MYDVIVLVVIIIAIIIYYIYTIVTKSIKQTTIAVEEAKKVNTRANRNRLLSLGIIVEEVDFSLWFDKPTLSDFVVLTQLTEKLGGETIRWQNTDREWIDIDILQAYSIAVKGSGMIQQIFIDN